MRCPDCNKFVSLETQEPEVSNLSVEYTPSHDVDNNPIHEFTITGEVRIVRVCADCSNELKEATLEIDQTVELGEGVGVDVLARYAGRKDFDNVDVEESSSDIIEEGGGRYAKSYYGATLTFDVRLANEVIASVEWSDKVAASSMDELV